MLPPSRAYKAGGPHAPVNVGPAAATHGATPVTSSHANGKLLYGRKDNYALGTIQPIFWNIVWDVQDFHQDFAGMAQAFLLMLLGLNRHGSE
jgi:hypothetical protein